MRLRIFIILLSLFVISCVTQKTAWEKSSYKQKTLAENSQKLSVETAVTSSSYAYRSGYETHAVNGERRFSINDDPRWHYGQRNEMRDHNKFRGHADDGYWRDSGYGTDQFRSMAETAATGKLSGLFDDREMFNFFASGNSLSPDASVGDRIRQELMSVGRDGLRNNTLSSSNVTRMVDAMRSGEDTDAVFREILEGARLNIANDLISRGFVHLRSIPFGMFQNLEGEVTLRKDQSPEYALTTIQPLYETEDFRHTFFAQGSMRTQSDDRTMNLGLAYRHMSESQRHLYGANLFYDHEWPKNHSRVSIGADYMTSLLSFHANRYWPLSDWKDLGQGYEERAMAGWDASVTGRLERMPEFALAARGYLWERDKPQDDLRGFEAGFDYAPFNAVQLGIRAGRNNDEDLTLASTIRLRWLFGGDVKTLLQKPQYNLTSVVDRRYERVERENRILKQERQKQALTARVLSSRGANMASLPDGSSGGLSSGMTLPYGTIVSVANTINALAEIGFGNGAILIVGQDTRVRLDHDNIMLISGIIRFISGTTDMTVNIPGGVITLIGTDIDVRTIGARSTVRVRDGAISVASTANQTSANIGDVIIVDGGASNLIAANDPDAELHRVQAHERLDLPAQTVSNDDKAAPYITALPTISDFTAAGFTINVPFSKSVSLVGAPLLQFTVGGNTRSVAATAGNGTNMLSFAYTASGPDDGENTIGIVSISPEGSVVSSANPAQIATLTVTQASLTLPGVINSGGLGIPTVDSITPSGITTSDNPIVFTVTFSEAMTGFAVASPTVTNGTVIAVTQNTPSVYEVSVTPSADGNVTIRIPANAADNLSGIGNSTSGLITVTSDRTAPTGYAVAWDQALVSPANQAAASFTVTAAEVNAAYSYSISSSGGGVPVTGSGTASAASFSVSPVDVTGLNDGTLTASITLTDPYGNAGAAVTNTVIKQTAAISATGLTAPAAGHYTTGAPLDFVMTFGEAVDVTNTPRLVLNANGTTVYASYHSGSGTNSITFRYNVLAGHDASPLVFGATAIDLNGGTISTSALGLSIDNDFSAVVPNLSTVIVDTTPPSGYAVAFTTNPVIAANQAAVGIDLAGMEVGANYALTVTSSNGGTPVTSTGTASAATLSPSLDLSGLNDGTLTATLSMTDVAGNVGAGVTGTVTKFTANVASDTVVAPAAGGYVAAANLDFVVTFPQAMTVTGTPRIALNASGTPVYAGYHTGTGTTSLTFRYGVEAGHNAAPLTFASTQIDLNGGTVATTTGGFPADLDFSANAPDLSAVIVDTLAPSGYSVVFDNNPVNGTNEAAANVTIAGLEVGASYNLSITSDNGGTAVVRTGTAAAASVPFTLDLSGLNDGQLTATLIQTDAVGNAGADVTSTALKATTSLSASITTAAALTNASPIVFTVTFSEAVTGFVAADLTVTNGTAAAPTTADNIVWSVNVTPSADGAVSVQLPAGSVENSVGTLNIASNTASTTSDRTAPTGQAVAFAQPLVNAAGASAVELNLSALEIGANYSLSIASSGGGAPVVDTGTVSLASMPLTLDLSTLGNGTLTATLILTDAVGNVSIGVSGTTVKNAAAPALTSMTRPANGSYKENDVLTFTYTWNQNVTVTDTPRLALDMAGTTIYADYVSGTGTPTLTFTYTILAGQTAAPLAFVGTVLDLNGGSITSTLTSNNAAIDFTGIALNLANVFVDTDAPELLSISAPSNRIYVTDESLLFNISFDEPMTITGTPRLVLNYGATTIYANYVSGSGSNTLSFTHIVTAADDTTGGVLNINNAIDLNGGTVTDLARNAPPTLTFVAPNISGIQMNIASCAGGTVNIGAPFLDGYCAGRTIIGGVSYDLIVNEPGCGYEPAGTSTTKPTSAFTPACGGTDATTKRWSDSTGVIEGGISDENGSTNTVNLVGDVQRENAAAAYCFRLDQNSRTDWFLPSINELQVLYQNMGALGNAGFATGTYWSSTEDGSGNARALTMSSGNISGVTKTNANLVRCVRRISPPQIVLNPNPAIGREGSVYNAVIAGTGDSGSLVFSLVSGSLPAGLTINSASGVISGTPTVAGVYAGLVIRVTDAYGQSETNPFSITITGLPRCDDGLVTAGANYEGGVCAGEVTLGSETYDIVVAPSGCGHEASGSATTKPAAGFTPTCTGAADSMTKRWGGTTGISETSSSPTDGIQNTLQLVNNASSENAAAAYCYHLEYGGYDDWYLPSVDELSAVYNNLRANNLGNFPAQSYWSSGQVSTTNASSVSFSTGLVASTSKNSNARVRCVRRVDAPLTIVQPFGAISDATQGLPYEMRITASGAAGGITYSLQSGVLPTGLSLNAATGVISGTPSVAGTFNGIVIRVTDSAANTADAPAISLTVIPSAGCNSGNVLVGNGYGGGVCAGEVTIGGDTFDLVATESNCAYEAAGTVTTKPNADFTPVCTGANDVTNKRYADATGTNELAVSSTSGLANTVYLLSESTRQNPAAAYCYHLVSGGHDDWYLPAEEELLALYDNLRAKGLGGFAGTTYISSTRQSTTQLRGRNFVTGAATNQSKTADLRLRCVRRENGASPLVLTQTVTPAVATRGLVYETRIAAISGVGPVTYSISGGTLPTGLTLNPTTGLISGTPSASGTYANIIVQATDGVSTLQTSAFTIDVLERDACNGGAINAGAAYGGGLCVGEVTIGGETFDLVATESNCGQETGGGTATAPTGNFTPTCTGATDSMTKSWSTTIGIDQLTPSATDGVSNTLQLASDNRAVTPAASYCHHMVLGGANDWYLPSNQEMLAVHNNLFSKGLGGGTASYYTSTQAAVNNGGALNTATGAFTSSTKTTAVRVRCVRRIGTTNIKVAPTPFPATANEDIAYSSAVYAAGGAGPLTYSLTSGSLPAGLNLNAANGRIEGSTSSTGTASGLVVTVSDGTSSASTGAFSLNVTPRARCSGGVMAGDTFGGGECAGNVTIGAQTYDLVVSESGCGFETSGTTSTKPTSEFTPVCSGGVDTMNKRWASPSGFNEGATSPTDGVANTLQLVSDGQAQNAAAAYCFQLVHGGHTDWYLPAEEELSAIYDHLGQWGISNFAAATYWSSTQATVTQGRFLNFVTGGVGSATKTETSRRVRCVRKN